MPVLPYSRCLTNEEFVRFADDHLLTHDTLPLEWQLDSLNRLRRLADSAIHKHVSQDRLPFPGEATPNGHA
jgi:hypothetical protein